MTRSKSELLLTAAFASSLFPNCLKFPAKQWTGHGSSHASLMRALNACLLAGAGPPKKD